MKELRKIHRYGNRFQLDLWTNGASPGDEDTRQGRQSTETLVALIKSKHQSSFNFTPPLYLASLFI